MAWDSSREVPWTRLMREWVIYVGIASVAFIVFYVARGKPVQWTIFVGLLSSGPMYLIFGAVLAKFGYQRKTYKQLREDRRNGVVSGAAARSSRSSSSAPAVAGPRPKPPPTRRTSTGPSQRPANKPKRR